MQVLHGKSNPAYFGYRGWRRSCRWRWWGARRGTAAAAKRPAQPTNIHGFTNKQQKLVSICHSLLTALQLKRQTRKDKKKYITTMLFQPPPGLPPTHPSSLLRMMESSSSIGSPASSSDEKPQASSRILYDIPCNVCTDHSSGKHYGIFACDGCAGFFKVIILYWFLWLLSKGLFTRSDNEVQILS